MKHLIFALLGAAAILGVGMAYAPAEPLFLHLAKPLAAQTYTDVTVFGGHKAVDNHDNCLTPEENLDNKETGTGDELILTINTPEEVAKMRIGFSKRIGIPEAQIVPFDQIQVFKSGEVYTFDVFNTAVGQQCEVSTFPIDSTEFTLLMQAADVQTIVSTGGQIYLGHQGNPDLLLPHNGHIN